MFKKIICSVAAFSLLALYQTNVHAATNTNDVGGQDKQSIYEKHYTVSLKNLDLKVTNGKVKVIPKKNIITETIDKNAKLLNNGLLPDKNADLLNNMLLNENFSKDLQKMIKDGHTPIAIGVAEAEFVNTLDKNGNIINSRPMTVGEVENSNSTKTDSSSIGLLSISGQSQPHGNLSLYTSVSGSGPDYWVQSNAYWSGPGDSSAGDEKIGITWESSFSANNSSSTTINYGPYQSTGSLDDIKITGGAVWDFANSKYVGSSPYYLTGAYAGMSVHRTGSYGSHYFTSNYIHTYQSYSFTSASVSYTSSDSKTGYSIGLSLTAVPSQWTLVSYVGSNF